MMFCDGVGDGIRHWYGYGVREEGTYKNGYGYGYGNGSGNGNGYGDGDGDGHGYGCGPEQPAAIRLLAPDTDIKFYLCQLHTLGG